jgi:ankyrin repeat protein
MQESLPFDRPSGAARRQEAMARLHAGTPPADLGQTLVEAAQDGDGALVRDLLIAGVPANSVHQDRCALAAAVLSGDGPAVQELLEAGADPNRQDRFGRSPLHLAAEGGRPEIVTLVVAAGADPRVLDKDGGSARDHASTEAVAKMLDRLGAPSRDFAKVRGLHIHPDASARALLVKSDQPAVLKAVGALLEARGWAPDIADKTDLPLADVTLVVYQLRGHAWTLVQALTPEAPIDTGLAKRVAEELKTGTILYTSAQADGHCGYDFYIRGRLRESFLRGNGEGGQPIDRFESTDRTPDDVRGQDAFEVADAFLRARDAFVPDWSDQARLATSPERFSMGIWPRNSLVRADLIYVR